MSAESEDIHSQKSVCGDLACRCTVMKCRSIKTTFFEIVGGNDNPQHNEQIIAIADKLLEYDCITTNQHQNIQSTFDSKK